MPPRQDDAELWARYATAARRAGCPSDQFARFARFGIVLLPTQLMASAAARACDVEGGPESVGYGGARGGGKSHWSLAQLVEDCDRFPGLKCLLLRKIGKKGKESFEDLRQKVLRGVPHSYTGSNGEVTFPNGSKIILGHYKDERNIDDYLGIEYDVIAVEESTTLTASKLSNIRTCLRSSKPGWRPRMYETTNPGGISHTRFKSQYIDPFRRGAETKTRFVPATVDDNPFNNKEYRGILESLTGWQREAWLNGNWNIAAGAFFTNWREDILVREWAPPASDWEVWLSLDHGFTHYTTAYLMARNQEGSIIAIDEHCFRRKLPSWHAPRLDAMLERNGTTKARLRKRVAGRDIFAKSGDKDGDTIADQYAALGWEFEPANDNRINGAGAILQGFGDLEAKDVHDHPSPIEPKLFVTDRCPYLIECLPAMVHDPHDPEDVLKVDADAETGDGGDDPYDGFRYGVMAAAEGSWVHNSKVIEFFTGRSKGQSWTNV